MTTSSTQPSAVIYDIAAKARTIRIRRSSPLRFAEPPASQLPTVDYGSGWYHEEAIREEERTRKQ